MRATRIKFALTVLAVVVASGCGSSSNPAAPPKADSTSSRSKGSAGGTESSYSGIGAPVKEFKAAHRQYSGNEPPLGACEDVNVRTDRNGRVIAYGFLVHARPPFTERELLSTAAGVPDMPPDRVDVRDTSSCAAWRSNRLGKLLGKRYVTVNVYGVEPDTGGGQSASVEATKMPEC